MFTSWFPSCTFEESTSYIIKNTFYVHEKQNFHHKQKHKEGHIPNAGFSTLLMFPCPLALASL
jgi:hypothetical protein